MHHCAFRGHKSALTRAQRCPCLGSIVPFLRHFANLAKQEYLLGILFAHFLFIGSVCSGFIGNVCSSFRVKVYLDVLFENRCGRFLFEKSL